eukprot:6317102-Amphidinium_carterae.1
MSGSDEAGPKVGPVAVVPAVGGSLVVAATLAGIVHTAAGTARIALDFAEPADAGTAGSTAVLQAFTLTPMVP